MLLFAFLFLYISFGHSEGSKSPPNGYFSQYPLLTEKEDALAFSDYRSPVVTFANVQYLNCYSTISTDIERYDIAILGAPFDTGTTGRPGACFGPQGIRQGSHRINVLFGYNFYIHKNPFKA